MVLGTMKFEGPSYSCTEVSVMQIYESKEKFPTSGNRGTYRKTRVTILRALNTPKSIFPA